MLNIFTWCLAGVSSIAIITLAIEWCIRNKIISYNIGRKCLHILAISICTLITFLVENRLLMAAIFFAASIVLAYITYKKILLVQQTNSYGIALFPLAFSIILLMPFLALHHILISFLVLGIADAFAGIAGYYSKQQTIVFLYEPKTFIGCIVCLFCTASIYFGYQIINGIPIQYLTIIVFAFIPALTELFSYKGSDNLTVPIVTALWIYIIESQLITSFDLSFILIMLLLAYASYVKKWLTISGATAAFIVGMITYFTIGLKGFYLPVFLLVTGSLLSKMQASNNKEIRNAFQVFCNGIIACVCLIIFFIDGNKAWLLGFCASFSCSISDSCSSEGGKLFTGKVIDIITRKPTPKGLSGGVSIAGTCIGCLTAIAASVISFYSVTIQKQDAFVIAIAGFTGMLLDSVMGSILQEKYISSTQEITENSSPTSLLIKGNRHITNNVVNLLSNAIITSLTVLLYLLN